jgi:hypothetical protein
MLPSPLCAVVEDRSGVAAMEFAVIGTVVVALLLPIADVASLALTYMRTFQAMRNLAAYAQYNPPPDITAPTTWPSLPNTMTGFSVTPQASTVAPAQSGPGAVIGINITVLCGDPPGAACTAADAANAAKPKWYSLSANLKLDPMYLAALTGGVISYAERFQ